MRAPSGYLRVPLPAAGSILLHRRSTVVSLTVGGAAVTVAAVTVITGVYELSPAQVWQVIGGGGSSVDQFIVWGQRVPRVLAALVVGACLGGSGAIFQSVARNPLGSPDIIGFTTGAATGGLVVILVLGAPGATAGAASASSIVAGTLVGGSATALAVVFFAARRGLRGDRLVLCGVAIAAMLAAGNDYLISRAEIDAAEVAKAWQYGSLNAVTWETVTPLTLAAAPFGLAALLVTRCIRALELGDEVAAGLGVPLRVAQVAVIGVGVALAAIAVAMAGPIGFLALAAPQLARRLVRSAGVPVAPAMAMGACLLVAGDLLAQRLLSPFQIPVGLVTGALGGAYLAWLLLRTTRR